MQIGGLSTNIQSVLGNSNVRADGSQPINAEQTGSNSPQEAAQVSGNVSSSQAVQPPEQSLNEVAAPQNETAVQTQVITSADEVLGTNIDTTA